MGGVLISLKKNVSSSYIYRRFPFSLSFTPPSEIPLPQTYNPSNTTYWRPSDKLQKVLRLLYEED